MNDLAENLSPAATSARGLDVSLKVSICIVKADGSVVWEGKTLRVTAKA